MSLKNSIETLVKDRLNRNVASARAAVLLIVMPACIIVLVYFFNIIRETVIEKNHQPLIDYENRFALIKADLPPDGVVNYVSDQDTPDDFVIVRYVLIPTRLVRGLKPRQPYLIVHYLDTDKTPEFNGFVLKKDYGNGVMLFKWEQ